MRRACPAARSGPPARRSSGGTCVPRRNARRPSVRFPDDFKGQLVLVSFWATWCAPCRREEPFIVRAYEKYHDAGLQIVGVTLDAFQRTPAAHVTEFLNEQHIPWPQVYTDGPAIAARYGVSAIPAAFLVDGDSGKTLASGEDLRGEALLRTLDKYFKSPVALREGPRP